jgi:hypothetical protein
VKESDEKTCPALFFLRKQAFISGEFRLRIKYHSGKPSVPVNL